MIKSQRNAPVAEPRKDFATQNQRGELADTSRVQSAGVAKQENALALGANAARLAGSTPAPSTLHRMSKTSLVVKLSVRII